MDSSNLGRNLLDFWLGNPLVSELENSLRNQPLIIILGSMYSGRNHVIDLVGQRLNSPFQTIIFSFKEFKGINAISQFWDKFSKILSDNFSIKLNETKNENEAFSQLIDLMMNLSKDKSIYVLINDFQEIQNFSFEEEIISNFEKLIDLSNLHFLISSNTYFYGNNYENDFPFQHRVNPIYLSERINRNHLQGYVTNLINKGSMSDAFALNDIIEQSGNEPLLIQLICAEISERHKDIFKNNVDENDVKEAIQELIKNSGFEIFKEEWLSITYIEQIALFTMALGELDNVSANDLQDQIAGTTAIETDATAIDFDFTMALEFLRRRHILYYNKRKDKYSFNNELLRMWLMQNNELEVDRYLSRIISKELAAFAKGLSATEQQPNFRQEFEKYLLNVSLLYNKHNKAHLFDDLDIILTKRNSFQFPVILHISDIQFGKAHAYTITDPAQPLSLGYSLVDDIKNNYPREKLPHPNIIIISGDIANWGMPEEYKSALKLIDYLCESLNVHRSNVVLVPGNHDVNWHLSKGLTSIGNDWRAHSLYQSRMVPFERFFNQVYTGTRKYYDIESTEGSIYTLYNFVQEFDMIILGFDSCCEIDHERDDGRISTTAITNACKEVEKFYSHAKYKIAVWHHNINQIGIKRDYLTNWDEVQENLFRRQRFQIGLYGHIHRPEDRYGISEFPGTKGYVFGAGTISVREEERAGISGIGHMNLSYNLIQLGLNNDERAGRMIIREARPYSPNEPIRWSTPTGEQRLFDLQFP